ncbi:MAG TPA: ABC transporter ATP-binding protein [Gaiellaceae bacterium]|nr:ABC transporter ATP-binding protein [Gaiellaceae bacterium]
MTEGDGAALLAAVGVRKRFGALVVLDGVDFSVGVDEAVGIVGPNGAGKTTLLNVFAGSLRPDGGSVLFRGADVTSAGAAGRCRLGIARAYQVPKPFGGMTVFENVFVGASTGGGHGRRDAYRRVAEVLEQCEMLELANRPAESLGLLHRKRLELARALATSPEALLLDEIAAGLTDEEASHLVATIRELRRQGVAIVWIEHIVHVLVQVVERLICMDGGRVIAEGEPEAVMKDAAVIDAYLGSAATGGGVS